jgi:hypothetical protein
MWQQDFIFIDSFFCNFVFSCKGVWFYKNINELILIFVENLFKIKVIYSLVVVLSAHQFSALPGEFEEPLGLREAL